MFRGANGKIFVPWLCGSLCIPYGERELTDAQEKKCY